MEREELEELHYITPICNVLSICEHGILSHNRAARLTHTSVAMQELQDRRELVRVPPGTPLHDFGNLYICGRNPMLYKRRGHHRKICVLRVSPDVMDLADVVVTSGNAASNYIRFAAAPGGLRIVDRELTFAKSWNDSDYYEKCRKSVAKCAEVLVPNRIDPRYIMGAYVSCEEARDDFADLSTGLRVEINRDLFFNV